MAKIKFTVPSSEFACESTDFEQVVGALSKVSFLDVPYSWDKEYKSGYPNYFTPSGQTEVEILPTPTLISPLSKYQWKKQKEEQEEAQAALDETADKLSEETDHMEAACVGEE